MSTLVTLLLLLLSGAAAPDAGAGASRDPIREAPLHQLDEDDRDGSPAALRESHHAPARAISGGPLALLPRAASAPPSPPRLVAATLVLSAIRPSIHVATRGARAPPA